MKSALHAAQECLSFSVTHGGWPGPEVQLTAYRIPHVQPVPVRIAPALKKPSAQTAP